MKDNKIKLLMISAISLVALTGTVLFSNSASVKSLAGISSNDKDRVFTLETLTVTDGKGRADFGNLAVYAPHCSSVDGALVRLTNYAELVIYCPTANKDGSGRYAGFKGSTVTSVTITFINRSAADKLRLSWCRYSEGDSPERDISSAHETNKTIATDTSEQTKTWTSSNYVLANQGEAKSSYPCLLLNSPSSGAQIDILSLTVEYSCK